MNLLYLHTHDMGRYNQLYGFGGRTPAFQQVADDGTLFRNAHCAQPTCSPSRAALLTGMWPQTNGVTGLIHRGSRLNDVSCHLSVFLRDSGFNTALFGVQHEAGDPAQMGYNVVDTGSRDRDDRGLRDKHAANAAAEYIRGYSDEKPFFIAMGLHAPHRPFIHPLGDINPNYVKPPACLPDVADTRGDYAHYLADLEFADSCAARVLSALKDSGRYEDTMILLTTDHGIAFPHMKCNLYDTGTGVTLALRIPGIDGGRASDALVSHIDVFPTLCDVLGLPHPPWLQGKSLLPIIKGSVTEINDSIFTGVTFHAAPEAMRAVRTNRYKYIRRFHDYPTPVLPNTDNGGSKDFLLSHGFKDVVQPREELYDLIHDPAERNNLIDYVEYAEVRRDMCSRLTTWMSEIGDALLHGDYPPPPGALLNPCTAMGPNKDEYIQF